MANASSSVTVTCNFTKPILIVASVALAVVYKYRMKNKAKLNVGSKVADLQKVRTLFWLTFIQSVLNVVTAGSTCTYHIVTWLYITYDLGNYICLNQIMAPVDSGRAIADMLDFMLCLP